ncbi:beta-glucosidase [Pigmentiphaga soli]|uniref:Beta-glucosidase n=1 Tax=Pigmentiphaga soli TaxID=1007095 RepID=A0ABP8GXJ3_9BURK
MQSPFLSFFQAGFECSTHRRCDGRRLDLIASTRHDRFAETDYRAVAQHGLRTVRDGVRWHLVERSPGVYDWSSFLPMLRAARASGVQPIWDLCHYGYPDGLDIWRPAFVDRMAAFAAAVARLVRDECPEPPIYCPVNEISFWAWAGGDMAHFNPCTERRGMTLKIQLARAAIAVVQAVRDVDPGARIVHADPAIHVVAASAGDEDEAAHAHAAQYEAWDMLSGRLMPELGGRPEYLDILGLNYYSDNQWVLRGPTIERGHPSYRPFRDILAQAYARYGRPMLVAETGAEGDARANWLRYVCGEVAAAIGAGVPVHGICLYPVLDYPGWADDRHCPTGLFGPPDAGGRRPLCQPLAAEIERQAAIRTWHPGRVPQRGCGGRGGRP